MHHPALVPACHLILFYFFYSSVDVLFYFFASLPTKILLIICQKFPSAALIYSFYYLLSFFFKFYSLNHESFV